MSDLVASPENGIKINGTQLENNSIDNSMTEQNIDNTKKDIENLIKMIMLRKKECDDMDNETTYMKEYVASFISMGELNKNTKH